MYFSKLLHGFVKIDTWMYRSCYMNLLKLLRGFVKVALCISCPLPKTQVEVWPKLQNLSKLLFWTKGVEWVKALGSCVFGNVSLSIFCSLEIEKLLQSHKKKKLVLGWLENVIWLHVAQPLRGWTEMQHKPISSFSPSQLTVQSVPNQNTPAI